MRTVHKFVSLLLTAGFAAGLSGCGTPGAPQPPSLNLPNRVTDLTAVRTGNQVSLTWTMPRKNTDKLLLKSNLSIHICHRETGASCIAAGSDLLLPQGTTGAFTEQLPDALTSGSPRTLSYFVEVSNRNGRSAGLSNAAVVLAGQAPAPVTGLAAELRKNGVMLRWNDSPANAQESIHSVLRLRRKLLTPNAQPKPSQGILAPPPEPVERNLLVDSGVSGQIRDRALDQDVRLEQSYEYRAQRVAQATVDGQTLELAGELSIPVRIEVKDAFPPSIPTALAAVATAKEPGEDSTGGPFIDLSWQPVTDADLAGYIVYRREADGEWQRISPTQPLVGPAFHDGGVAAGHTYRYQVTAIDLRGHESARSVETEETVPAP